MKRRGEPRLGAGVPVPHQARHGLDLDRRAHGVGIVEVVMPSPQVAAGPVVVVLPAGGHDAGSVAGLSVDVLVVGLRPVAANAVLFRMCPEERVAVL